MEHEAWHWLSAVGLDVGTLEGCRVGWDVGPLVEGVLEGLELGCAVGSELGLLEGVAEGSKLGCRLGESKEATVGTPVGNIEL